MPFPLKVVKISGHSMQPIIRDGELCAVNQWAYLWRKPETGEIVIFEKDGKYFCKRVAFADKKNGTYEVSGDNREDSLDSRKFGTIPNAQIIGKVILSRIIRDIRVQLTSSFSPLPLRERMPKGQVRGSIVRSLLAYRPPSPCLGRETR